MKTKTKTKKYYEAPTVKVFRVELEKGIAQTGIAVSMGTRLIDWDDGGMLGVDPEEGGDIILNF